MKRYDLLDDGGNGNDAKPSGVKVFEYTHLWEIGARHTHTHSTGSCLVCEIISLVMNHDDSNV